MDKLESYKIEAMVNEAVSLIRSLQLIGVNLLITINGVSFVQFPDESEDVAHV